MLDCFGLICSLLEKMTLLFSSDSHKHKDKYKEKEHKHKDHKKDKEREKSKHGNRYGVCIKTPPKCMFLVASAQRGQDKPLGHCSILCIK